MHHKEASAVAINGMLAQTWARHYLSQ